MVVEGHVHALEDKLKRSSTVELEEHIEDDTEEEEEEEEVYGKNTEDLERDETLTETQRNTCTRNTVRERASEVLIILSP